MDEVINKLNNLYEIVNKQGISPVDFLHNLNDYMVFVKNDKTLNKIVIVMKEDKANEEIQIIKESINDITARDIYEYEKEKGLGNNYPIFEYERLIEFPEEYNFIKDLKTEKEVNNTKINIEIETPYGKGSKQTSGGSLLTMVKLNVYSKQIKPLHEFFIERLNWIKEHGVFSKSLDYDENKGILYFQEKEIPINVKKVLNNSHYLLSHLMKNNPFEKHFCDELNDEKVLLEDDKHWKSYYDACVDIQKKVQKATEVSDFLDFTSGKGMYVCLNSKYSLNK